jgi:hypothetical protein
MRQSSQGLSLKTTVTLIVIVFLLGAGFVAWYFALYKVAYVKTYDIQMKVVNERMVGFNIDPNLHYGKLPLGSIGKKEMNLFNDWDIPLLISIRVKGNASQFIKVEENNFIIDPDETRKLFIYAEIPSGFENLGNYSGEARVMYLRP